MKIGFDIDGVLANFVKAYQPLFVKTTGRDTFAPTDIDGPPEWNWPTLRGYTAEETKTVWDAIRRDETFWLNLEPLHANVDALKLMLRDLEWRHEVYYLTDRGGVDAKRQTKRWLMDNLNYHVAHCEPTVLIAGTGEKGHLARALKLDAYIDDKPENVEDVIAQSPKTRLYYPVFPYNLAHPMVGSIRVDGKHSIATMLDIEIAKGNL